MQTTTTTTTAAANAAGVPRQRLDFVYDSQGLRVSKAVSTSESPTCEKCCLRVSCEVGPWINQFDYDMGYVIFQHDRIPVDPVFK